MTSHADSDSDSEGDYCYYYNVFTEELMKLPRLTRALQHYYQREKPPEQPRKGTWTIISPATGYILRNVLCLLHHARQANDHLPPVAIKDLKAAHKIVLRATKLSRLVHNQLESNAGYRELYWEFMPKLLDVLKGVVEDFKEGGVVEQAI